MSADRQKLAVLWNHEHKSTQVRTNWSDEAEALCPVGKAPALTSPFVLRYTEKKSQGGLDDTDCGEVSVKKGLIRS